MRSFTQEITDRRREQLVVHEANKILKSEWKPTALQRLGGVYLNREELNREVDTDEAETKFKILPYATDLEKEVADRVIQSLSYIIRPVKATEVSSFDKNEQKHNFDKPEMVIFTPIDLDTSKATTPEIQLSS